MTPEDFKLEQARHRRRLALMRMQGDLYRSENRAMWLWIISAGLGLVAIFMAISLS